MYITLLLFVLSPVMSLAGLCRKTLTFESPIFLITRPIIIFCFSIAVFSVSVPRTGILNLLQTHLGVETFHMQSGKQKPDRRPLCLPDTVMVV